MGRITAINLGMSCVLSRVKDWVLNTNAEGYCRNNAANRITTERLTDKIPDLPTLWNGTDRIQFADTIVY
ncbi:hypothetical protein AAC387_Pa03g3776 [Persea americana]